MCQYHLQGLCKRMEKCNFAHSFDELKSQPDLRCTKYCPNLKKFGCCEVAKCSFAHDKTEIRKGSITFGKADKTRVTHANKVPKPSNGRFESEPVYHAKEHSSDIMLEQPPPLQFLQAGLYPRITEKGMKEQWQTPQTPISIEPARCTPLVQQSNIHAIAPPCLPESADLLDRQQVVHRRIYLGAAQSNDSEMKREPSRCKPIKMRTNQFYTGGNFNKMGDSQFAHSINKLQSSAIRLCPMFARTGECTQLMCKFAHSIYEFRSTDKDHPNSIELNQTHHIHASEGGSVKGLETEVRQEMFEENSQLHELDKNSSTHLDSETTSHFGSDDFESHCSDNASETTNNDSVTISMTPPTPVQAKKTFMGSFTTSWDSSHNDQLEKPAFYTGLVVENTFITFKEPNLNLKARSRSWHNVMRVSVENNIVEDKGQVWKKKGLGKDHFLSTPATAYKIDDTMNQVGDSVGEITLTNNLSVNYNLAFEVVENSGGQHTRTSDPNAAAINEPLKANELLDRHPMNALPKKQIPLNLQIPAQKGIVNHQALDTFEFGSLPSLQMPKLGYPSK